MDEAYVKLRGNRSISAGRLTVPGTPSTCVSAPECRRRQRRSFTRRPGIGPTDRHVGWSCRVAPRCARESIEA